MVASLNLWQWAIVVFSALVVGLSKTGLPGIGILAIPLLAGVLPARESTGFVLPMLILADLFAVGYYRRKAVWRHLVVLIPWAAFGVIIGYGIMGRIADAQLRPLIGGVILVLLGLNAWRQRRAEPLAVPRHWAFAASIGLLAGVTTMLANAAGPIMVMYLIAMQLPKREFIGTGAWYFFVMNLFKVPFSRNLGLITLESLTLNAILLPVVALGAVAGIVIVNRLPQARFLRIVEVLAAVAAIRLLW